MSHAVEAGVSGAGQGAGREPEARAAAAPALPAEERPQAPASHCTVGPDSVGSRLAHEALCFGGRAATATDAAVLLGRMEVAGATAAAVAAARLGREQAEAAWEAIQGVLERAVDHVKTQAGEQGVWGVYAARAHAPKGRAGPAAHIAPSSSAPSPFPAHQVTSLLLWWVAALPCVAPRWWGHLPSCAPSTPQWPTRLEQPAPRQEPPLTWGIPGML